MLGRHHILRHDSGRLLRHVVELLMGGRGGKSGGEGRNAMDCAGCKVAVGGRGGGTETTEARRTCLCQPCELMPGSARAKRAAPPRERRGVMASDDEDGVGDVWDGVVGERDDERGKGFVC